MADSGTDFTPAVGIAAGRAAARLDWSGRDGSACPAQALLSPLLRCTEHRLARLEEEIKSLRVEVSALRRELARAPDVVQQGPTSQRLQVFLLGDIRHRELRSPLGIQQLVLLLPQTLLLLVHRVVGDSLFER